jgi:nitrogen regulatory protein P-II 1
MKMIVAMIKPFKLQDVTLALEAVPGFPGMTVSDAKGFGRTHLEGPPDRQEDLTDFRACVRVEILVDADMLEPVLEGLLKGAHTGARGDGRVVVYPVERTVDIETFEPGG